ELRFKREIQLARKVTHPNVCRVFDLFHHRLPAVGASPEREVGFISMELVEGETLARLLQRVGRLTTAEARPLVRQMAAGLQAAHQAGVVHRDFKPGNVLLSGEGPRVRAVVTDFGLARSEEAPAGTEAATGTGFILGTAAYMAPEQVEGVPV